MLQGDNLLRQDANMQPEALRDEVAILSVLCRSYQEFLGNIRPILTEKNLKTVRGRKKQKAEILTLVEEMQNKN